jgi:hypothetical protein
MEHYLVDKFSYIKSSYIHFSDEENQELVNSIYTEMENYYKKENYKEINIRNNKIETHIKDYEKIKLFFTKDPVGMIDILPEAELLGNARLILGYQPENYFLKDVFRYRGEIHHSVQINDNFKLYGKTEKGLAEIFEESLKKEHNVENVKFVDVDCNWEYMDLGLIIYNDEGLMEGEIIIGQMEGEEWIGKAKNVKFEEYNNSCWYLEIAYK